jgi:hypothetical protein
MEGRGTFNLASRSATIPVERQRVTRLAGESELRLLQQPISAVRVKAKFADFPLRSSKRFFLGRATTSVWRQLGSAGGIFLTSCPQSCATVGPSGVYLAIRSFQTPFGFCILLYKTTVSTIQRKQNQLVLNTSTIKRVCFKKKHN